MKALKLFLVIVLPAIFFGCNSFNKVDDLSDVPEGVDITQVSMYVGKVQGNPDLEKVVFIHRHAPEGNISTKGSIENAGNAITYNTDSANYKLTGVKWGSGEPYYVKPDPRFDLPRVIAAAFQPWNGAEPFAPVFTRSFMATLPSGTAYGLRVDNVNTVSIGNISMYGANALAITQYVYNRYTRQTVEFDQVYNQNVTWKIFTSTSETPTRTGTAFDLQDVATHEHGHIFGLGDLYYSSDRYLTMYGYAAPGETLKRTLGRGDIAGIQALY